MGQGRRRRPSRGLSEKQERFVRLIARGVSNAEACRRVGINRRTGTRWRFGRTVLNTAGEVVQYPPVRVLQDLRRSLLEPPTRLPQRRPDTQAALPETVSAIA
jgi:Homeodomain-like domain